MIQRFSYPLFFKFIQKDQLFIAMHIISSLLENDWIKFYYTLPFNPERGMENIKKDVDDANLRFNRGDVSKVG